jgi:hypothetical protein
VKYNKHIPAKNPSKMVNKVSKGIVLVSVGTMINHQGD